MAKVHVECIGTYLGIPPLLGHRPPITVYQTPDPFSQAAFRLNPLWWCQLQNLCARCSLISCFYLWLGVPFWSLSGGAGSRIGEHMSYPSLSSFLHFIFCSKQIPPVLGIAQTGQCSCCGRLFSAENDLDCTWGKMCFRRWQIQKYEVFLLWESLSVIKKIFCMMYKYVLWQREPLPPAADRELWWSSHPNGQPAGQTNCCTHLRQQLPQRPGIHAGNHTIDLTLSQDQLLLLPLVAATDYFGTSESYLFVSLPPAIRLLPRREAGDF